jgi:hypothetical protein
VAGVEARRGGEFPGTTSSPPRRREFVEKPLEIRPALEPAYPAGKPAVVNVMTGERPEHTRALVG